MTSYQIAERDGSVLDREAIVSSVVIAGWTGRDTAATEAHLAELEAIGVARPSATPLFYRVAASLVTDAPSIEVLGTHSSGEVETVTWSTPDEGRLIGVGSDHTDRVVEAQGVAISKQICAKPVGRVFWRFDDVAEHWDELITRSWAIDGDHRRPYQEGSLASLRPPTELIELHGGLAPGQMLFGGTQPVSGQIGHAPEFELELHDPVLNRYLRHRYQVATLPVIS